MDVLRKLLLIHPTKCAGTSISKKVLELKGYSKNKSNLYSGYSFNIFFQRHINYFYAIIHSKGLLLAPVVLIFYFVCLYFKIRNIFKKHIYGLTFNNGSIQHFSYKQWKSVKKINSKTICLGVVCHPQKRIASSYYFLGYDKHISFLDFVTQIKNETLLSSIKFTGFRAIIKQHVISISDYFADGYANCAVNFIFKQESLNDDWLAFCKKYNIEYTPLSHINKTKSNSNWKQLYNEYPQASKIVYDLYEKDFKAFNYKKVSF